MYTYMLLILRYVYQTLPESDAQVRVSYARAPSVPADKVD